MGDDSLFVCANEVGWTVGADLEVALVLHWTAKAAYLFVDFVQTVRNAVVCYERRVIFCSTQLYER
jgi:hypothetical protein